LSPASCAPSGRFSRRAALVVSLCVLSPAVGAGAELQEQTSRAYETYRAETEKRFVTRQHSPGPQLSSEVIGRPAGEDGIIGVSGGLIHHWFGACFMRGVKLQTAIGVMRGYDAYPSIYKETIASRVLQRDGDTYRVLLRLKEGDSGISAILDVRSTVRFVFPDRDHALTLSSSQEIREVRRPGASDEELLPPGRDSGYLWRADVFTAFTQTPDGLYVETETLGLSRSFPPMLGWFIRPIARRLGRKSVVRSLEQFEAAVVAAAARGQ
jgi:hypothetical protein